MHAQVCRGMEWERSEAGCGEWLLNLPGEEKKGPVVILHFRLSLWDNELKCRSHAADMAAVSAAEEAGGTRGGYSFLNPSSL